MKIKQIPEDFVVEEVLDLKIEEGPYFYYKVCKKSWNTLDVVREVKKRLKVRDVGYAGLKDRNAVTTQYISVKKKINFNLKDVSFDYLGKGKQRIYKGMLEGNKFTITVRDLDKKLGEIKEVVNLFGEQRFGKNNALLGKYLVQKKFKEVCEELSLEVQRNDYVGALKKHGVDKLKIYVAAYQSELWNKLAKKSKKKFIPILGFVTEGNDYEKIMEEEEIVKKDFIIRPIPEIAAEGSERDRIVEVSDFKILSFEDDDLNIGKKKQVVEFYLQKGAYATVLLESLLNR